MRIRISPISIDCMKKVSILLLSILIICGSSIEVAADQPIWPFDYILKIENSDYVFVMLAPSGWDDEDPEIRARYAESDLYHVDDHTTPIWTVNWYALQVFLTADGKHLVRIGPWPVRYDFTEMAVQFYEEGTLIRSYQVSDLVANPLMLPQSASHYSWIDELTFSGDDRELFLRTPTGEKYRFDVTTGTVKEGRLGGMVRSVYAIVLCLGVPGLFALSLLLWRKKAAAEGATYT